MWPFVEGLLLFVLDKTCSYKWCSSRHIFPCLNSPNMADKLDYTSVAFEQWLVLAVVNSSDWDTDDHTQSCNGLDKEIRKMKKLYNSAWGIIHDSYIPFKRTYQQSWHSRKTAAMIRAPCSTTKATMTWATNCFVGLRNFIAVIWAGCPWGLPFERGRGARSLAFWILVSLRVFWPKPHYI